MLTCIAVVRRLWTVDHLAVKYCLPIYQKMNYKQPPVMRHFLRLNSYLNWHLAQKRIRTQPASIEPEVAVANAHAVSKRIKGHGARPM